MNTYELMVSIQIILNQTMNSRNSRRKPLLKLFGKLRSMIAIVPSQDAPYRSWERAASREIQLEFDFDRNSRIGLSGLSAAKMALRSKKGGEMAKTWCQNSIY